jgi:hypothetical protein
MIFLKSGAFLRRTNCLCTGYKSKKIYRVWDRFCLIVKRLFFDVHLSAHGLRKVSCACMQAKQGTGFSDFARLNHNVTVNLLGVDVRLIALDVDNYFIFGM